MRFLDVADFVRDPNSGSAGSLLSIADALTTRGHEVDHLWKQPEPYRLPHPSLSRWLELPRRQFRQVSDQLARARYDVVMISQPYGYLAFENLPAKYPSTLFLNVTHGWEDRFNAARLSFAWDGPYSRARRLGLQLTKTLVNRACRRTLRACHGLISPSASGARYVQREYDMPAESVAVIPYGLDEPFLRSDVRRSDGGDAVRMLYVGNYLVLKGSAVLESILPAIGLAQPQASITFVVPGDAIDRIRSRFEPAFGQRLTTVPWLDRRDLISLYGQHDVLLFPSLFEGFGKTFLEGMACAICVVGFNEGGLPDIAANGTEALYCETGVVADLRKLLERCLRTPGLTREIGQRAQQVAQQYSWARTAERIETFCHQRRQARGLAITTSHALDRDAAPGENSVPVAAIGSGPYSGPGRAERAKEDSQPGKGSAFPGISRAGALDWFDNPGICRSLPPLYRAYAWYSRLMADRSRSIVRGGSLLLSVVITLTKTLQLTRDAAVPLHGLTVFIDLCDRRMLWVFGEVESPSHEARILHACLRQGDTFLDIGANHGSYSLMAAPLVGSSGTVTAFEPQPRLASLLRRSFEANRFRQATVHECACAAQAGEACFYLPSAGSGSAGLYARFSATSDHRRLTVTTVRLDDAIDWPGLPGRVLMKLDVEGSELSALQGAEQFLRGRHPTIIFELNPLSAEAAGGTADDVLTFLTSVGYTRFAEIDTFPESTTVDHVDRTRLRNLVALPDGSDG